MKALAAYAAGILLLMGSVAYGASPVVVQDPSNVNRNMAVNADGSINATITGGGGGGSSYAQGSTTAGQDVNPMGCRTLSSLPTDTTAQTNMPACTTRGELSTHDATLATLAAEGVGNTAASVPAQAIYMGCRAATANPTAVTDGQLVGPMCSKGGKTVVDLFAPSDLRTQGHATATDNAAHTLIAAGAGSLKNYITDIQCSRNDAGTSPITLTFSDAQSSTMMLANAGNGGVNNFHMSSPIVTAAATAFTFTASTGTTTVACNAQGYQAP